MNVLRPLLRRLQRRDPVPRPPCIGATHVIPVPAGMTPEEAWQEIVTLGQLHRKPSKHGLTWAVVECPGGQDCECRHIHLWRHYRRYLNDRLVEARVFGMDAPEVVLPLLDLMRRTCESVTVEGPES
jgi:hypothetical protein